MNKKVIAGVLVTVAACTYVYAMDVVKTSDTMMKDDMVKKEMMKDNTMMYDTISMSSSRDEVSKVQMMLVEKGYLHMPMGVSYGYYGPLTTAAYMKYKNTSTMSADGMEKSDSMKTSDTMMKDDMVKKEMMKDNTMMYDTISMSSSRDEVSKVQMMLVEKGYLVMPASASYGYYGPITTAAYAKYKNGTMIKQDIMKKSGSPESDGTMMKDQMTH